MANKVMFIPADPKHYGYVQVRYEYTTERGPHGAGLNKAQLVIDDDILKGRSSVAVWYDGGTNPFISSLNTGQIYIRGHGMPGSSRLELARTGGEWVDYTEIVQRLIASGLKREYTGQIKCFNCHSAEAGGNGEVPFAQHIADEMYARGYRFCSVYGYTDAIDSYPMSYHKGAPIPDLILHKYRRGPNGIGNFGRAKTGRVQFYPRIRPLSMSQKMAKKFYSIESPGDSQR